MTQKDIQHRKEKKYKRKALLYKISFIMFVIILFILCVAITIGIVTCIMRYFDIPLRRGLVYKYL